MVLEDRSEGPSRRTITALFTDVVGSTRLAESVDPESWGKVMARFFQEMAIPIERHEGTVEKFIGDAVRATFGVPVAHEDDALRAVRAAIEMRGSLARLNEELESRWGLRLETRTGINTGEVVSGAAIAGQSLVLGDATNVAARLERAAAPGEILIGADTYRLVSHAVLVEPVPPIALRGKTEPVITYRLLSVDPDAGAVIRDLGQPMVGREAECERVLALLEQAARDHTCELVTVIGPPGIGKSRLVAAVADRVADNTMVLQARCLSYGEEVSLQPVIDLIKQALATGDEGRLTEIETRIEEHVGREDSAGAIVTNLTGLLGVGESSIDAELGIWAARRFLEILSRRRPLCLIVEDIHWARPALLEFLRHLADRAEAAPILLLCISRPELLDEVPAWSTTHTVVLKELETAECERFLVNLLGAEVTEGTLERVMKVTGGNPLFIEQIISMLRDVGVLRSRVNGEGPISADVFASVTAPPSIQALLASRIDRLSAPERQVSECAAVLGDEFSSGAIAELLPQMTATDIGRELGSLRQKQLLSVVETPEEEGEIFRFAHALIRDAVYDAIPKESRAIFHRNIARSMEVQDDGARRDQDDVIGYHLEQAFRYQSELGPLDEEATSVGELAATRLAAAGRRALSRHDGLLARSLFTRATSLPQRDDRSRVELMLDLADALMVGTDVTANDGRRARAMLTEVIEEARTLGDKTLEMQGVILEAYATFVENQPEAAEAAALAAESAISVFQRLEDPDGLARAWNLLTYASLQRGHMARLEEAAERSIEHSMQAGNLREEAWGRRWLMISLAQGPKAVGSAIGRLTSELEWARSHGNRLMEGDALAVLGLLKAMTGAFEDGRGHISEAKAIAVDLGSPTEEAWVARYSARVEIMASKPLVAEEELRFAYPIFQKRGEPTDVSLICAALADLLYVDRRYEEADEYAVLGEQSSPHGHSRSESRWKRVRAKLLARSGDDPRALKLGHEAVDLLRDTDYSTFQANALMDLAEVYRLADRAIEAIGHAQKALALYERKENLVAAAKTRALIADLGRATR